MLTGKPWRAEAVIQFCGSLMFCFFLGGMIISLLDKAGVAAFKLPGGFGAVLVATLSFQGAAWVLIGIFLWQHQLDWREAFGLRDPRLARSLGRALLMVAVLLPVLWALQSAGVWALTRLGWPPDDQEAVQLFENAHTVWGRLYMGLFAVVLAPVAEEFVFRGMLFPFVRQLGFPRLAWLGVSALFALIHFDAAIFIPLFVLALGLTWLYVKTGNLLAAITAHAVFNAVNLVLLAAEPWLEKVLHLPAS
jgi:membrane protease YdiL (CAAX protease family)